QTLACGAYFRHSRGWGISASGVVRGNQAGGWEQRMVEAEMSSDSCGTVNVRYREIDGFHVFTSDDVRGLYVASKDVQEAYGAIAPTIQTLLELNEQLKVKVIPAQPLKRFLDLIRGHALPSVQFAP